jgi:hypothetical protein
MVTHLLEWILWGGVTGAGVLWKKGLLSYVIPIPVWILVSFVILIPVIIWIYKKIKLNITPKQEIPGFNAPKSDFLCYGLLWKLTQGFYSNFQTSPNDDLSPDLRKHYVAGPFCPGCNREIIDELLVMKKNCECGRKFFTDETMMEVSDLSRSVSEKGLPSPLEEFRYLVYREARAKAMRKEI